MFKSFDILAALIQDCIKLTIEENFHTLPYTVFLFNLRRSAEVISPENVIKHPGFGANDRKNANSPVDRNFSLPSSIKKFYLRVRMHLGTSDHVLLERALSSSLLKCRE